MEIRIKRVYEDPAPDDGYRVLVDRLWPRGVRKADLALDRWAKELAPSTEARRAFGHRPENFEEFKERYLAELNASDEAGACARELLEAADGVGRLTLLYAAKDPACNHALVLAEWLRGRAG